jgi:hypothetical protein
MLDYTEQEKLVSNKHCNLLGLFQSYEEISVVNKYPNEAQHNDIQHDI